ncbi:TolC family protein [Rhizobium sp. BR 315]|uniref:TolC family protein n=1 Tax=Rhizobium sp. BR 315 TaxID=3040014 RepID=UPI003D343C5F
MAGLVLALSACQSSDLALQVTPPPLPNAYDGAPYKTSTARSNTSAWWEGFHDKTLSSLVSRAESMNLTVAMAHQSLTSARALANSAMSAYQLDASVSGMANAATGSRIKDDFTRRPVQLNLDASWEIPLFGQDKQAQKMADLSVAMATEDVAAAKVAVTAEIASNYVHLRALQKRRFDTAELVGLLENNTKIAGVKEQAGLATSIENEPMRAGLDTAKSTLLLLDSEVASTRQQIATLLGSSTPDPALFRYEPQPIAVAGMAEGKPADLLRARPDVLRAEYAVGQTAAQVGIAKADLYPKLRLNGTIGIGTPVSNSILGAFAGPSVQLPIFDYGRRKDAVAAREAEFRQSVLIYKQAVLVAYEEASRALHEVNAARARTAILRARLQRVSKLKASTDVLVREGLAEKSKSITGAIDLLELRSSLTESIENEARATIAFYKATRGVQPVATVDDVKRPTKAEGRK